MVLLAVRDVEASKRFYGTLFGQKVIADYGWNAVFSGGFAVQQNFAWLTGLAQYAVAEKENNVELYFETEDFDGFIRSLSQYPDIVFVHQPKEHHWRQRVVRIYDPDFHMIEIGESMRQVVLKCLAEGMDVQKVVEVTQQQLEFVREVARARA